MATLYAGPGKVWYHNAAAIQPEGENGTIELTVDEKTSEVALAMFGKIGEQVVDTVAEIKFKPFDDWSLLQYLFPAFVGVSTAAPTTGALVVGTKPFGSTAAGTGTEIYTPDGRLYHVVRTAITGHPTMHFGVGKALFGDVTVTGIGDETKAVGASGYLISGSAVTESGATDPDTVGFSTANFIRGAWTGVWGTATGFTSIEAEDEWTLTPEVKYSPLTVQGRTVGYKLDSAAYMLKCKPYGPTHSNILAIVAAHTRGQLLGQAAEAVDLVLTGPSSKTVTLKAAAPKGVGFSFGGTTLGTGEVGFVNVTTFSAGAPQPLLVFA